jgi:hypothetical protein
MQDKPSNGKSSKTNTKPENKNTKSKCDN